MNSESQEPPIYEETQSFHWIIKGIIYLGLGVLLWTGAQQYLFRELDHSFPTMADWVFFSVVFIVLVLLYLILRMKLVIQVYHGGVQVAMKPLVSKWIGAGEIASAQARTYRPMGEYGGWGIRGFGSNRALNARGNRGVQLVLRGGDRLLLGTQKPEELERAIQEALRSK